MPRNDRVELNNDEGGALIVPHVRNPDPEEAIGSRQPHSPRAGACEDLELVAQCKDLELQRRPRAHRGVDGQEERHEDGSHGSRSLPMATHNINRFSTNRVFSTHSLVARGVADGCISSSRSMTLKSSRLWGETRYELQRTQKVENVLLLAVQERIEVLDHDVCFGSIEGEDASAAMREDRRLQVRRSSIVQEEQPLSQPPQRGGAKLRWSGLSLPDAIGQAWAHVVNQQVGEKIHRLIAQRHDSGIARVERGRMTEPAPDVGEQLAAFCD